jgi:hypothetical protein
VTEVEDVAAGRPSLGVDAPDLGLEHVEVGEQQRGVEVALQHRPSGVGACRGLETARGLVERQPPVDADDVRARLAHGRQQVGGADAEVDAGHAGVGERAEHGRGVRQHQLAVVPLGQGACPRVEQLHRVHAGRDLHVEELAGDAGELVQQRVPGPLVRVHERLGALVVAARPALDEVGRERERRAGEPDQRGGAQLVAQQADRAGDRPQLLRGDVGQGRHGCRGPHRLGHHRAGARHDVDTDPGRDQRHHDVAEQDRRVDVVAAHRLQRDLADHLRVEAGLEHRHAFPQRAVLGQRAAGLPHEPDRRVDGRLAGGGHEKGRGLDALRRLRGVGLWSHDVSVPRAGMTIMGWF